MRVGLSCTSIEGAIGNLAHEIPHWDFDRMVQENEKAWSKALSVLDAEMSSEALNETFCDWRVSRAGRSGDL